ncbi:MAG: tetratricopeptide repeat protein [Rickettsiaceae bacterium]
MSKRKHTNSIVANSTPSLAKKQRTVSKEDAVEIIAKEIPEGLNASESITDLTGNALHFFNLATTYYKLGQYQKAIILYLKSVSCDNSLDNISKLDSRLTNIVPSVLEKKQLIVKLIIPLNKALIQKNTVVEKAKLNIADTFVEYTKLTLVGGKALIERAIKLYYEVATDQALQKVCVLALNELFSETEQANLCYTVGNQYALRGNYTQAVKMYEESIKLNPEFLDVYVQAKIVSTELGQGGAAKEYHIKASKFFESVSQKLHEAILEYGHCLQPTIPKIQSYLFDHSEIEMSGADTMLDAIDGI